MSQQLIRGSLSHKIVELWKKFDKGQIGSAKDDWEKRNEKAKIYTLIQKELGVELSNHKDPRSMIRRSINTHIFGYKPKKVTRQE